MKGLEWQADGKALLFSENHTGVEHAVLRELNVANGSVRDRLVGLDSAFSDDFSAKAGRLAFVVNSGVKSNIWRGDLLHPNAPPVKLISTTRSVLPKVFPGGKARRFWLLSRWPTGNLECEQNASRSGSHGENHDRKLGPAKWPWHSDHDRVPARSIRGTVHKHC